MVASFASLVLRYRRAGGEERLQLKWFVTAAAFVAVAFSVSFLITSSGIYSMPPVRVGATGDPLRFALGEPTLGDRSARVRFEATPRLALRCVPPG
jgi:hypothetical protein